jgi:hypothetical protein
MEPARTTPTRLRLVKGATEVEIQLADLASRVTIYRNALIEQGLPRVLVNELVRDYHAAFVREYDLA